MVRPSGLKQNSIGAGDQPSNSLVVRRSGSSANDARYECTILLVEAPGDKATLPVGSAIVQAGLWFDQVQMPRCPHGYSGRRVVKGKSAGKPRDGKCRYAAARHMSGVQMLYASRARPLVGSSVQSSGPIQCQPREDAPRRHPTTRLPPKRSDSRSQVRLVSSAHASRATAASFVLLTTRSMAEARRSNECPRLHSRCLDALGMLP